MKNELPYFYVDTAYGGNQSWFRDPMMKLGGCAAVTACDACIYLSKYAGMQHLYPYDAQCVSREDYIAFSKIMKPYLRPRWQGVDTLDIYTEGFGRYLANCEEQSLQMERFSGTAELIEARKCVKAQIDAGYPIPYLMLKHKNPALDDYIWHWFLVTGYDHAINSFLVKTVTYGEQVWMDFDELWNTGYARRGGLILFHQ